MPRKVKYYSLRRKKGVVLDILLIILSCCLPLSAADVITNGSFTTDNTGWSHTDTTATNSVSSDSADYTGASPAHNGPNSIKITSASGKHVQVAWYDSQSLGTINAIDIVKLSLWWRKVAMLGVANDVENIYVTIVKPDMSTVDVWSDLTMPLSVGVPIYGSVTELDVSDYFDQDGTYQIRLRVDGYTSNTTGAYIVINWDDVVLDVVAGESDPPAAVTNLSALKGDYLGEIDLSWSAPGDDGWSGTLGDGSEFRIQYGTYPAVS
ncbi:MAG: hypothetical protein JXJ19_02295, partial [Elusimicrobia bacterium]|nr:hypothetical protein [Elusimicrobiota bacterium]